MLSPTDALPQMTRPLALCSFFSILGVLGAAPSAAQTTWHVDAAVAGPGSGTATDPYSSIQYAIDQTATAPGDIIELAAGVYDESVDLRSKPLTLRGGGGSTIDRNGLGVGLIVEGLGDDSARVEGVRFQDCVDPQGALGAIVVDGSNLEVVDCVIANSGEGPIGRSYVGGVSASSSNVRLVGTEIIDCFGHVVGAISTEGGSLELVGCRVARCQASEEFLHSCGLSCDGTAVHLSGTTFENNDAGYVTFGCAFLESCETTVESCVFRYNSILGATASLHVVQGSLNLEDTTFFRGTGYGSAGHVYLEDASATVRRTEFRDGSTVSTSSSPVSGNLYQTGGTSTFEDCIFRGGNASTSGGAAFVQGAQADLLRCVFEENSAFYGPAPSIGSAILCEPGTEVTATETIIRGNQLWSGPTASQNGAVVGPVALVRCTLTGNVNGFGGPACVDVSLDHSIVWGNGGASLGGSATATWSDIEGGAPGAGNFDMDPLLDPEQSLSAGSPCIDSGNPALPKDADGSPLDVGARPWTWPSVGAFHCDSTVNSSGAVGQAEAYGAPAAANGTLYLRASDLPAQSLMMFLVSDAPGSIQLGGGGMGTLCLASPIGRFQQQAASTDASGVASIAVDETAMPVPGGAATAGETYWFQGWFRDAGPGGVPTSRVTTAVTVDFL